MDAGGATVSTIFDLFDDSTTTTKGYLRFEKTGDPTVWAQFAVTGSVVDGTGYRKITLTSGAGSGAFTNGDTFAITFYRSGDKGTDGAGTGDFSSNTASSVDGEVVLFSGTGGKTGKRATGSGLAKLTSGVLGTAASGTDYAPATSGSAILKGNGSGGFSSATAGTDYLDKGTTSLLTAGYTATSYPAGTKSSGTFTPDPALGNFQHVTNNGAHTLAPPASVCTMILEYTNGASAGAITTSGFHKVTGDTYVTTSGKYFHFFITRTANIFGLNIQLMN